MNDKEYPQDTSVNPKVSSILGTWQNLQIILGQQVQRYIQSVNTKNQNNRRGVSISDINGLLSFLESTINNTLSVTLNQKISISKLKTQQNTMNESNNGNKQTIRLNESQVNNLVTKIVKESVKRIISEEQQRLYHWDISTMNDEMEALSHVKSSDALFGEYEGFNGFKTPNAAFNSGLKELKKYTDGSYIMEVWCYVDQANGKPPTTEYVDGYLATNVNGIIRKF